MLKKKKELGYDKKRFETLNEKIKDLKNYCDNCLVIASINGEKDDEKHAVPSIFSLKGDAQSNVIGLLSFIKTQPLFALILLRYFMDKSGYSIKGLEGE